MLHKHPDEWTREDAITISANFGAWANPIWAEGGTAVLQAAGVHDEASWFAKWMGRCPYFLENPQPHDKYVPMALLLLDLVRSEIDTQSEAVIACAAMTLHILSCRRPSVAKALWDDGFLDVRALKSYGIASRSSTSS